MIRAIIFPYSNKIITTALDGQINEKFGNEFVKILERTLDTIKTKMIPGKEVKSGQDLRAASLNNGTLFLYSILLGIMTTCELINFYGGIN